MESFFRTEITQPVEKSSENDGRLQRVDINYEALQEQNGLSKLVVAVLAILGGELWDVCGNLALREPLML
jgi:hypothetical protein